MAISVTLSKEGCSTTVRSSWSLEALEVKTGTSWWSSVACATAFFTPRLEHVGEKLGHYHFVWWGGTHRKLLVLILLIEKYLFLSHLTKMCALYLWQRPQDVDMVEATQTSNFQHHQQTIRRNFIIMTYLVKYLVQLLIFNYICPTLRRSIVMLAFRS